MKIKVLLTGGTIGSELNGSAIDVADDSYNLCKPLFDYYYRHRPENVTFSTKTVLNILSENISPENWKQLYDAVCEVNEANSDSCDGLIITHGTDTLAYTSAFLAFMLNKPDFPIALVSSNSPLHDEKASGYKNFTAAIDFIIKERAKCVFVPVYKNGKTYIHLGSRLTQAHPFSHCFKSVGGIYFGFMDKNGFHRNKHKYNPDFEELNSGFSPELNYNDKKAYCPNKNIFYIKPFPGLNYNMFDFKEKPAAILHELYHSGTACVNTHTEAGEYSVINFAKKCIADGIDFYAAPFDSRYSQYVTSEEMRDAGVQFISNMSAEAAYVKLNITYGLFRDKSEIIKFIEKNIAFEKIF